MDVTVLWSDRLYWGRLSWIPATTLFRQYHDDGVRSLFERVVLMEKSPNWASARNNIPSPYAWQAWDLVEYFPVWSLRISNCRAQEALPAPLLYLPRRQSLSSCHFQLVVVSLRGNLGALNYSVHKNQMKSSSQNFCFWYMIIDFQSPLPKNGGVLVTLTNHDSLRLASTRNVSAFLQSAPLKAYSHLQNLGHSHFFFQKFPEVRIK